MEDKNIRKRKHYGINAMEDEKSVDREVDGPTTVEPRSRSWWPNTCF